MELLKQVIGFFISIVMSIYSVPVNNVVRQAPSFYNENNIEFSEMDSYQSGTVDVVTRLESGVEYNAMISGIDERHIYTFTATERGYIKLKVTHEELKDFSGWRFALYREYYLNGYDGEKGLMLLNILDTTAYDTVQSSPSVGLMPGDYRIIVTASSGVSDREYKLTATFTASLCHEIECNDTRSRYTEIYSDVPMIGSSSVYENRQDDDWYLLRVQKSGRVSIRFSHERQDGLAVAWRIILYNEAGDELYSENSGINISVVESGAIGVEAGNYSGV